MRRVGVLTGSSRELMRGCVVFPLVNAATGQMVNLYSRSLKSRGISTCQVSGAGMFNPQGAKNADEVIITESVIDAAALSSAGLRNVIPTYGTTGLTDEIIAHLVECRFRRAVLMLDTDEAGRAAAVEMAQRLTAVNIEARSVELAAKDAAEFMANGGTADDVRRIIAPPMTTTTNETRPAVQVETSADGSMLFTIDEREYRIRGLSPVGLERLRVNVRLSINGAFHLDTIGLYQARARALFAQTAAKLCAVGEQQVSAQTSFASWPPKGQRPKL